MFRYKKIADDGRILEDILFEPTLTAEGNFRLQFHSNDFPEKTFASKEAAFSEYLLRLEAARSFNSAALAEQNRRESEFATLKVWIKEKIAEI